MKLKLYTAILITPLIMSAQGCGIFCQAYTQNGTTNMDGYCANHRYIPPQAQPNQQQAPAYDWSSAPQPGSLTPSFSGGGNQIKLIGTPDPKNSQQVNPTSKSCMPNGYGGFNCN